MNDDTHPTAQRPPRRLAFVLRWAACAVLIGGVFATSRLMADGDRERDAPLAPTEESPSAAPASSQGADDGESLGLDDQLEIFDEVIEEILGLGSNDPSATDSANDPPAVDRDDPSESEWPTVGGDGAGGGSWTITHPTEWQVSNPTSGFVHFSAPDYPNIASVVTRPYVGPLEDEAKEDIDQLMPYLSDGVVVALDNVEIQGREAVRADLDYTNPTGGPARASVLWIRDGDTLYLVTGEAPHDRPDLQELVDQVLNSFLIGETI